LDILKIFQNSVEGETPLRGVGPQKTPEETFEIKDADPSSSDDAVNYTDVQVGAMTAEAMIGVRAVRHGDMKPHSATSSCKVLILL